MRRVAVIGAGFGGLGAALARAHAGDAAVQALQQEIEAWCRRQFTPAARPMHIRVGPQLPRNEMGKHCDWPLQG